MGARCLNKAINEPMQPAAYPHRVSETGMLETRRKAFPASGVAEIIAQIS